ncbi:hypothetical protein JYU34_018297, partial [Plutella xylostella]
MDRDNQALLDFLRVKYPHDVECFYSQEHLSPLSPAPVDGAFSPPDPVVIPLGQATPAAAACSDSDMEIPHSSYSNTSASEPPSSSEEGFIEVGLKRKAKTFKKRANKAQRVAPPSVQGTPSPVPTPRASIGPSPPPPPRLLHPHLPILRSASPTR